MQAGHVRTAAERLADPRWRPGERVAFWLTVATLGCFTFLWFGLHALRQFHTARRERDEAWAVVWGTVAFVSWWNGAGLELGTTRDAAVSLLVWALRLGSLLHVHLDHTARMAAAAAAEVAREQAMIDDALAERRPQVAGPVGSWGGRFDAPEADPFATGRTVGAPEAPRPAAPRPAAPRPATARTGSAHTPRGRTWGRPEKGAPPLGQGRRLETPAPHPAVDPAAIPGEGSEGAPTWIPGLEPRGAEDLRADAERDGRGDPAAPPTGRVLDL